MKFSFFLNNRVFIRLESEKSYSRLSHRRLASRLRGQPPASVKGTLAWPRGVISAPCKKYSWTVFVWSASDALQTTKTLLSMQKHGGVFSCGRLSAFESSSFCGVFVLHQRLFFMHRENTQIQKKNCVLRKALQQSFWHFIPPKLYCLTCG